MNMLGALLLAAAGLLGGLCAASAYRRQAEEARALCQMLELMQFELERFRTPLPELFSALSDRSAGRAGELCRRASAALAADGVRFREAWTFACGGLSGAERQILLPLGDILGRYGAQEQTAALASALSDMRQYSDSLWAALREKCRLCVGLSTAAAVAAAVLLM